MTLCLRFFFIYITISFYVYNSFVFSPSSLYISLFFSLFCSFLCPSFVLFSFSFFLLLPASLSLSFYPLTSFYILSLSSLSPSFSLSLFVSFPLSLISSLCYPIFFSSTSLSQCFFPSRFLCIFPRFSLPLWHWPCLAPSRVIPREWLILLSSLSFHILCLFRLLIFQYWLIDCILFLFAFFLCLTIDCI